MALQDTKPSDHRIAWLISAPLGGLLLYGILAATTLGVEARATAAVTLWIAIWWITEPIPIAITSILPILLLPLFGVSTVSEAATPYSDKIIFLFLGAFLIATALEKWQLHRRLALATITVFGTRPSMLVAAFMLATAFISLWISKTAVALMMLPVGVSVTQAIGRSKTATDVTDKNFSVCLVLGIAYATSIGGLGTIIGTPPNTLLVAFLDREYGSTISFAAWIKFGMPLIFILLPATWFLLTHIFFPLSQKNFQMVAEAMNAERRELGPMRSAEKRVLAVFVGTALMWILRPLLSKIFPLATLKAVDDTSIAILGALCLFVLPANPINLKSDMRQETLLDWSAVIKLPWHILLLFGGGLSIAAALEKSGFAQYIGAQFINLSVSPFVLVLLLTTVIVFFGEIASNTVTAAIFLPIVASVAKGTGTNPYLLLIPVALASSLSFMIPVGTPPNALAYGTGHVTMGQMIKVGIWLDLLSIVCVSLAAYLLISP